jgi:hypothetical protein
MGAIEATDRVLGVEVRDQQPDQVEQSSPDGEAPEQAKRESVTPLPGRTVGSRRPNFAFLSILVAVQLAWISVLGYSLYLLA